MGTLFDIRNKIIVISGATGVLGSSIAEYLAAEGAIAVILGRNAGKVTALVKLINDAGGEAHSAVADVTDEAQLIGVREELESKFQKIDVLINAAGGNMPGAVI
ncbi:MAG TPA: SDR family NAD(P)-dependent oxidoreductase, partial [Eudoraea sp.]|nr:SDR family NAD(P)-dependent oxidoreductase [Eudoraea sp.]